MSKFKVLWIDDQIEKVALEIEKTEDLIREKGFEPIIDTKCQISHEDLKSNSALIERINSREYDLLFIDFNLCNHILGSNIISKIRENNKLFIDIIFYSSDREKLISEIKRSFDGSLLEFIDDVHIAILDDSDIYEKIENVIDKIIGTWYNAHSMRGVILAKTSKFETLVNDVIRKYYIEYKDTLVEKVKEKKLNVCKQFQEKWDNIVKEKDPSLYIIEHPESFNWNVRRMLFDTIMKNGMFPIVDGEFVRCLNDVFETRNKFAHNRVNVEGGKIILHINDKKECYDEAKMQKIREEMNTIEAVLETLLKDQSTE